MSLGKEKKIVMVEVQKFYDTKFKKKYNVKKCMRLNSDLTFSVTSILGES